MELEGYRDGAGHRQRQERKEGRLYHDTTPFTGLQDDLDRFKAECSLYICLQGSEFPNKTSQMLFILSYMKGRATGTWVMHIFQQVLNPSRMPMTMDKFEAEVDLVFADLNQEATA